MEIAGTDYLENNICCGCYLFVSVHWKKTTDIYRLNLKLEYYEKEQQNLDLLFNSNGIFSNPY